MAVEQNDTGFLLVAHCKNGNVLKIDKPTVTECYSSAFKEVGCSTLNEFANIIYRQHVVGSFSKPFEEYLPKPDEILV